MAAAKGQGLAVAGCNYVGHDQIWKDHVSQEMRAAKKWPENWQFLTQDYRELVKDQFPIRERKPVMPPTPLRIPEGIPLNQLVEVLPSTKPVPKTTAGLIGWRSGDEKLKLEKYGKYADPKGALIKQLNWPIEGIE